MDGCFAWGGRLVQALTIAWKRKAIDSPGKAGNVRLWALRAG